MALPEVCMCGGPRICPRRGGYIYQVQHYLALVVDNVACYLKTFSQLAKQVYYVQRYCKVFKNLKQNILLASFEFYQGSFFSIIVFLVNATIKKHF